MKFVNDDETLDATYAVIQIAETLHRTANLAEKMNDTKAMMDVVAGWFELHERFVGAEEDVAHERKSFGFSSARCDDEVDTEAVSDDVYVPFENDESEEEDDGASESDG